MDSYLWERLMSRAFERPPEYIARLLSQIASPGRLFPRQQKPALQCVQTEEVDIPSVSIFIWRVRLAMTLQETLTMKYTRIYKLQTSR